jgi:hypothetical protein
MQLLTSVSDGADADADGSRRLIPPSRVPGFIFHQTERTADNGTNPCFSSSKLCYDSNVRDFDLLGYKYSLCVGLVEPLFALFIPILHSRPLPRVGILGQQSSCALSLVGLSLGGYQHNNIRSCRAFQTPFCPLVGSSWLDLVGWI